MPGPQPRLHLPYRNWPAADQRLWQQAFSQNDLFPELHLSKATRDSCMWSYRRFLGFLNVGEPEALQIPPAERLTIERVKLLVLHLRESNAPNSVAAAIAGLHMAARAIIPAQDWDWLKKIKSRLHTAVPARSRAGPVITSVQLLEVGLKLMETNTAELGAPCDVHKAIAYRDGLISAVLAFVPLRPKNLISLHIGKQVIMDGDRCFILVPREETKTQKRIQFEIPELLIPYIQAYLQVIRPGLLRRKRHAALWVSQWGGTLSYVGLVKIFGRLSAHLGVRVSPHDARDAAVTTWAIARPSQITVARDLLYHSKLDTTGLYNRAKGIEASRAYRTVISQIRTRTSYRSSQKRCA